MLNEEKILTSSTIIISSIFFTIVIKISNFRRGLNRDKERDPVLNDK